MSIIVGYILIAISLGGFLTLIFLPEKNNTFKNLFIAWISISIMLASGLVGFYLLNKI